MNRAEREIFAQRLRDLCATKESVSQVCRDLDINRQQFAKYLSGTIMPSVATLAKIIRYFDVSLEHLAGDSSTENETPLARDMNSALRHMKDLEDGSLHPPRWTADGYYLSYSPLFNMSMGTFPVQVCLIKLVRYDHRIYYRRKFSFLTENRERRLAMNYVGYGLPDRIGFFFRYVERYYKLSFGVMFMRHIHYNSDDLQGLYCANTATRFHESAAVRVYFEYIGEKVNLRELHRKCGIVQPEDLPGKEHIIEWVLEKNPGVPVIRAI